MTKIKFNDLKTIGYSFKVSTNKVEDKYITYTVSDYKTDVKDAAGVSGVRIILSISNTDKKGLLIYKDRFIKYAIDNKVEFMQPLSDGIDVEVVF